MLKIFANLIFGQKIFYFRLNKKNPEEIQKKKDNPEENQADKSKKKFADRDENSINFCMRCTQLFNCFCRLNFLWLFVVVFMPAIYI